ncbi:hypothetical protein [Actinomadura sp. B10D3]|uniref:hypothetical protein n=1 Tax=Actinomadura sp. B10D3 TaxID=3153557 RepID=UPI00325EC437
MGVEHGGSDKGPETGDKPTKPDSASAPPPDNPGSPGQQSRIESLKAAGWNVNGQQESSERGQTTKESSPTGSSAENASAAPKTEKVTGSETGSQPGDGKSEPGRPKPETVEAAPPPDEGKREPRTTEPGERHPKAEAEPQSTSERNGEAAKNTEPLGHRDGRTESGEKPRADDTGKPPTEAPDPSKPMTRRESLQNAGWDLGDPPATSTDQPRSEKTDQNAAPLETRDGKPATNASGLESDETTQQDKPAPPVAESDNAKADEPGDLRASTDDRSTGKAADKPAPELGETGPQAERDGQAHPRDADIPAGEQPTTNTVGDTDQPTGQTPKDQPSTGNSETKPAQETAPEPETPEKPPPGQQLPGTDRPTNEDPQPATPETATIAPESADHGARPQEQQPEQPSVTEDETRDAPADQRAASDAPSPPTETRDHDKKTEETDLPEPFTGNDPPDRDPTQTGETEELGRELSSHEENLPEPEPNPYRARITLRRDSDGNFIQESRFDVEDDTPDRAEPRDPEDDPALRDYRESDPESRSRTRDFMREFTSRADDIRDTADKTSEPAQKNFEEVRPTGQLCGSRPAGDQMKPPDNTVKGGSLVLAAAGTLIIVTEVGRVGLRAIQHMRGRENAGDR